VLRAIQGTEPAPLIVKGYPNALLLHQPFQDCPERLSQMRRLNRVEQIANLLISGDFRHPEQTLRIVAAFAPLHVTLVCQERGALHEKHPKGPQCPITNAVLRVLTGPLVW